MTVSGEQDVTADISYACSLSLESELARMNILFDMMYAEGDDAQPDVYGLTLLPSLDLGSNFELVARYHLAASDGEDGLRLQKRYEREVENIAGDDKGDFYQSFYLGLNFYLHGDRLKLMTGVEYSNMDGGESGGSFDGYTWFSGIRLYF